MDKEVGSTHALTTAFDLGKTVVYMAGETVCPPGLMPPEAKEVSAVHVWP